MTALNKHIKKHHDTYVYKRRVPKALTHLYKGISDDAIGRVLVVYGKVTENGIGLCIEDN